MMYIKDPLNYMGGKYKLLPQILPLFPDDIEVFYDLFGGGFNVGINTKAKRHVYNDTLEPLVTLLRRLYVAPLELTLCTIDKYIETYQLSDTNKEGYLRLRQDYNQRQCPFMFYTLIAHSFNHQIRFNKKGEFNMPFGKERSYFNPTLRKRFIEFVTKLKELDVIFTSYDFRRFDVRGIHSKDFVYCDPPYLLTTATYNEQGGWTNEDEQELLNYLTTLDKNNVKFALSNVLESKGNENKMLKQWAKDYNVHLLKNSYRNSNYQRRNTGKDLEVLITNY
jgi:DNA adenine methylase